MDDYKLDFWINKGYNVLFKGKHGVGKTEKIKEAFERSNLKWQYFSGSTMDPFIDFVGVPVKVDVNGESVIRLVMPEHINPNEIEAIFIDEYNRSHKKVRNATMELIQFKSINGKVFPNLKVIWVAINPDDEDEGAESYDVEALDPAQKDRFHVFVNVPYRPDAGYFMTKYGDSIGKAAVEWWENMGVDGQKEVSPRRLDYAVQMFLDGGDIADVVPRISNPKKLKELLNTGPADIKLRLLENKTDQEKREWLAVPNNLDAVITSIVKDAKNRRAFLPFIPTERVGLLLNSDTYIRHFIFKDVLKNKEESVYLPVLQEIAKANLDPALATSIKSKIEEAGLKVPAPTHIETYQTHGLKFTPELKSEIAAYLSTVDKGNYFPRTKVYKFLLEKTTPDMDVETCRVILTMLNRISTGVSVARVEDSFSMVYGIYNTCISTMLKKGEPAGSIASYAKTNCESIRTYLRSKSAPTIKDIKSYIDAQEAETHTHATT